MKIVSFQREPQAGIHAGALLASGAQILDFDASGADLPKRSGPFSWLDLDHPCHAAARELVRLLENQPERVEHLRAAGAVLERASVRLTSPVPRPGKVICIGLNYRDHAAESGLPIPSVPLVFSKFPSCVIGSGEDVVLPPGSEQSDYEAELGVVIGRRARRVPRERALEHVLGYVNVNDVSARDFQFADGQWQRGKSADTFCPVGEYVATREEIPRPEELRIRLRLNGETMQDSTTRQLVFGIAELVSYLSGFTTLEPGDLIATGTPPGVGFARKPPVYLRPGDRMEVEVEGLGVLSNRVVGSA